MFELLYKKMLKKEDNIDLKKIHIIKWVKTIIVV